MSFSVTHVTALGATTVNYLDQTEARSHYALMRATPATAYCQLVANGRIVKQFQRNHKDEGR